MLEYVRIYDNVFSEKFCDHLIEKFNKEQHTHTFLENHRDFNEFNICCSREWSEEIGLICHTFNICIENYKSSCMVDNMMFPVDYAFEECRIKKYTKGAGQFNDHVDVRDYASARRFLAFFVYLNDVEVGGETTFYTTQGKVKIQPKKGSILMFPPMWMFPHKGETPISNDKYIIGSYLHYV